MFSFTSKLLFAVDPSLGRVDKGTLSQHTLMELFIENVTEKRDFICGSLEAPKDIWEWEGLRFNEKKEVTKIFWTFFNIRGSVSLKWLPNSVTEMILDGNQLHGEIDFGDLPKVMEVFSFCDNHLSGSLSFENSPSYLREINIHSNEFTGSVYFQELPATLSFFSIANNKLSGTLDFERLPANIKSLYLNLNAFSGEVKISNLPDSLMTLNVSNTNLSGEIHLGNKWKNFTSQSSGVIIHRNLYQ